MQPETHHCSAYRGHEKKCSSNREHSRTVYKNHYVGEAQAPSHCRDKIIIIPDGNPIYFLRITGIQKTDEEMLTPGW